MLPGFRFLFAAIVLSMSILVFGLGAAALLRAAHEEFASMPSRRAPPEPVFAQQRRRADAECWRCCASIRPRSTSRRTMPRRAAERCTDTAAPAEPAAGSRAGEPAKAGRAEAGESRTGRPAEPKARQPETPRRRGDAPPTESPVADADEVAAIPETRRHRAAASARGATGAGCACRITSRRPGSPRSAAPPSPSTKRQSPPSPARSVARNRAAQRARERATDRQRGARA